MAPGEEYLRSHPKLPRMDVVHREEWKIARAAGRFAETTLEILEQTYSKCPGYTKGDYCLHGFTFDKPKGEPLYLNLVTKYQGKQYLLVKGVGILLDELPSENSLLKDIGSLVLGKDNEAIIYRPRVSFPSQFEEGDSGFVFLWRHDNFRRVIHQVIPLGGNREDLRSVIAEFTEKVTYLTCCTDRDLDRILLLADLTQALIEGAKPAV